MTSTEHQASYGGMPPLSILCILRLHKDSVMIVSVITSILQMGKPRHQPLSHLPKVTEQQGPEVSESQKTTAHWGLLKLLKLVTLIEWPKKCFKMKRMVLPSYYL